MKRPPYERDMVPFARRLRRKATPPERLLWSRLHRRALGVRFLRQRPVGRYVADFWAHDAARTAFLEAQGHRALRIPNDRVLTDLDGVVERLRDTLGTPLDEASR